LCHREALEYLVGSALEYPRERLLDQRNQILTQHFKVLIDCLIDDLAERLVASKQILQIHLALLDADFDVDFVDDEVRFAIDLLVDAFDAHVSSAAGEIAVESASALDRQEEDFAVHHVLPDHIQVW